jgi:hypothetical protein
MLKRRAKEVLFSALGFILLHVVSFPLLLALNQ